MIVYSHRIFLLPCTNGRTNGCVPHTPAVQTDTFTCIVFSSFEHFFQSYRSFNLSVLAQERPWALVSGSIRGEKTLGYQALFLDNKWCFPLCFDPKYASSLCIILTCNFTPSSCSLIAYFLTPTTFEHINLIH